MWYVCPGTNREVAGMEEYKGRMGVRVREEIRKSKLCVKVLL